MAKKRLQTGRKANLMTERQLFLSLFSESNTGLEVHDIKEYNLKEKART